MFGLRTADSSACLRPQEQRATDGNKESEVKSMRALERGS